MATDAEIRQLARWIRTQIQSPQRLDDEVLAYARSTFGSDDLALIMDRWDGSDTDSLLDLMFYPDPALQGRFERGFGTIPFTRRDQQSVLQHLASAPLIVVRTGPSLPSAFTIEVPTWVMELFVQRLKITWQPEPVLAAALDDFGGPSRQLTDTRVQLRSAPLTWQDHQAALMGAYIAKMPWSSADYDPCLRFLLTILAEYGPHQTARDFLTAKKEFYFHALCNAEDFERRRRAGNMETLMLTGQRAIHGSPENWRRCIRRVDAILIRLVGQTTYLRQPCDAQTVVRGA